ncbi:MAG: 4-phosphopantetheinyl transferase family protein [Saprospiraceae bacterium]|nr:4-phosphopantetheinyl transferase family protein [Saprospiraceae bacterium]
MLGNDIVDLSEVLGSGQAKRPGFKERICLDAELEPLRTQFGEEYSTWVLWAAKESAYKHYIQADGPVMFAPKKFCFTPTDIRSKRIKGYTMTPLECLTTEVHLFDSFLVAESYTSAASTPSIHRKIYSLDGPGQKAKSKQLKQLICSQLTEEWEGNDGELNIKKDSRQVPFLYQKQQRLPYSISLSHHGAWGLLSYLKRQTK